MTKSLLGIVIVTMGFSGLIAQMLLLRELLIVFSGSEFSIGIVLSHWLILEALGSLIMGKKGEGIKNSIEVFCSLTILFSIVLPIAVYFIRILKGIIGVSIGESIGFLQILYSSFLILLPISITHGALFTLSCKIYSLYFTRDAPSIGRVYVYEMIGTILGGIAWTYLLIPYLQAFQISVLLAVVNFFVLSVFFMYYWQFRLLQKPITIINNLLLVISVWLFFTGRADRLHHLSVNAQYKGLDVVHYQNSIYGNISVIKSEDQFIFFSDGIPELITPIPDIEFVEKFAHLPLLAHPNPKHLLILSSGAGGVIDEILKHPSVEVVEYAELDPLFLDLIKKFSTPLTEYELTHKRVQVRHIDGRLYLKMVPRRYDLIFVGLSNPSSLQINRFFTKEFLLLAEKKLNEDGILVTVLPGSLSYLSDELKNLNSCIFNTLKGVFQYVRVFPGEGTNLFLSSNSEAVFLIDKTRVANRLKERNIKVNVLIARHIDEKLHPGWQGWFLEFIKEGTEKINQDFSPLGVFYSIAYWNSIFAPYLCKIFKLFEKINLLFFLGLFFLIIFMFYLLRTKITDVSRLPVSLCIATTGFAGMIFDLVLIFAFQAIYGYVFSWIGLLVTLFMVGASMGAVVITYHLSRIKNHLKFFIVVDMVIILFSLGLPFIVFIIQNFLDNPNALIFLQILFLVISFISGVLIGAQFPLASKIYLKDDSEISKTAGVLYSADLLGGWLGGIAGGVVLLPVLGLLGSCMVVVLLKLTTFIIISQKP